MKKSPLFLLLIGILILTACNMPVSTTTPANPPDTVNTIAAMTVAAMSTQLVEDATSTPSGNFPPTATLPAPTKPPISTPSITPSGSTEVPQTCDQALFVKDVSIPDGTSFAPGDSFTKTWELKNTGTCSWNSGYSLVFANEGTAMDGPASQTLTTGTVAPGQSIQISVNLKAPDKGGSYRGYWQLRNGSNVLFGSKFYVDIKVTIPEYNLVDNYCKAEWRNNANDILTCPGAEGDVNGFVIKLDKPALENKSVDDESALWTNPPSIDNGTISGKFPAVKIVSGNKFKAVIGCLDNATNCNVIFSLKYKADGGAEQTLAEWNQTFDGSLTKIDLDLSTLAGKSIEFVLSVRANGPSDQDEAFWLQPRVTQ